MNDCLDDRETYRIQGLPQVGLAAVERAKNRIQPNMNTAIARNHGGVKQCSKDQEKYPDHRGDLYTRVDQMISPEGGRSCSCDSKEIIYHIAIECL